MVRRFSDAGEFLLHTEELRDLVEIPVTVIRSSKASTDGNGSSGSWHFHHEVGVMWYGHKARECRSTQDGVVLRWPIHHFEFDPFSSIVILRSEDDVETDLPKWHLWLARDDSVEGCIGGFELG